MKVKIELYATLRDKYGAKGIVVECDGSIKNLIEQASKLLDEDFFDEVYDSRRNFVREDRIFTINGRNIKDIKGEIRLKEGDVVAIFPPIAGG